MTERSHDAAETAAPKQALRSRLRADREALPRALVESRSRDAAAQLLSLSLDGVRTIALYAGMRGELDPSVAAPALRQRGMQPVYPRVAALELTFHAAQEAELVEARGLREPAFTAPSIPLTSIDAFVVPGLGFTTAGDRLGSGRGYYDRTLAAAPRALRIGYAHPEQLVPSLPVDAHDERVDLLVFPQRISSCAPRPGAPDVGAQP